MNIPYIYTCIFCLQLTLYTSSCRQEGLAYEVLQWYICRMEAWFAADLDMISLKNWDEVSHHIFIISPVSLILDANCVFEIWDPKFLYKKRHETCNLLQAFNEYDYWLLKV